MAPDAVLALFNELTAAAAKAHLPICFLFHFIKGTV
jgi:hypothetical protein